jgi:hypothetical protein
MANLPSTPADGNVKVAWVVTIANTTAPTAAELTAGSVVDVSCYLTADGFTPALDEQVIIDQRLCDTATFEKPGRAQRSLNVRYIDNSNTALANVAFTTLIPNLAGFFVVRRGMTYTTAFAAAQKVDVWPVQCGQYSDEPPEANSVLKVAQKMFVTDAVQLRKAVA